MSPDSDEEILQNWYEFAASQPGSVDSYLRLLRERQGKSLEQQREEFGASLEQFSRLRSMRLPRSNQFTMDAKRMADACQLAAPLRFVQDMTLARNLSQKQQSGTAAMHYRAAFDDSGDLDEIPGE